MGELPINSLSQPGVKSPQRNGSCVIPKNQKQEACVGPSPTQVSISMLQVFALYAGKLSPQQIRQRYGPQAPVRSDRQRIRL